MLVRMVDSSVNGSTDRSRDSRLAWRKLPSNNGPNDLGYSHERLVGSNHGRASVSEVVALPTLIFLTRARSKGPRVRFANEQQLA
jgi:hypothetical protein